VSWFARSVRHCCDSSAANSRFGSRPTICCKKVIDNVQHHLGLSDTQVRFSRSIMRNYGNMSSPTVMYVLDEVMRKGDPRQGDIGVMVALGPGMAAEAALIRW